MSIHSHGAHVPKPQPPTPTQVRQNAPLLDVAEAVAHTLATQDVHLHLPAGAVPKDGPSAGVAMCVALLSLLCGVPAAPGLAMTGEATG